MDSVEVELQLKPKGFPNANQAGEGASNSKNLHSAQIFDNPLASSSPQDLYEPLAVTGNQKSLIVTVKK